jgi:hypothetical protein
MLNIKLQFIVCVSCICGFIRFKMQPIWNLYSRILDISLQWKGVEGSTMYVIIFLFINYCNMNGVHSAL